MNKTAYTLLSLLLFLSLLRCGNKFDYEQRYTGTYAVRESVVTSSNFEYLEEYNADVDYGEDSLVFFLRNGYALTLAVTKNGSLNSQRYSPAISGSFLDNNTFEIQANYFSPFGNYTAFYFGNKILPE
jgi:hypothetical protein